MNKDNKSVAEIAAGLTETQRLCADLLDDFPCVVCGAPGPSKCPLPPSTTIPARDLINGVAGLGNYLRREASKVRAHLSSETSK